MHPKQNSKNIVIYQKWDRIKYGKTGALCVTHKKMIKKMANNGDIGITCIDGNTSPTTKFDSQLAVPATLTAAALES